MNDVPSGVKQVGAVTGALLWMVARLLPGEHRQRYETELRAEMVTLSAGRRLIEVSSLVIAAPTLRRALHTAKTEQQPEEVVVVETTQRFSGGWRCAPGRHSWIRVQDGNLENLRSAHLECGRCGRTKETKEYEKSSSGWTSKPGPMGW